MPNILSFLKVAPHAKPIEDPAKVKSLYRYWRWQTITSLVIGYAVYYFVRKNFSMAMPSFLDELGYTKTDLGIVLTLFSIVYGVGKFANGVIADRANSRYMLALGLLAAAIVNILFGLSSGLIAFSIFWILNGWFQSLGMPASVRLLTHWYSPTELGTKWGIQSTAHQIGGAGILIFAGWLVSNFGWRSAFYIPAFIAIVVSFLLIWRLRDTPQSIGLPPVEEYRGEAHLADPNEDQAKSIKEILFKHVLNNRLIWIIAIANIFVYIVRIGIMDWAPTFLVEARGSTLGAAGLKTAAFELAGIGGAIGMGWASDFFFKGRRGPLATVSMFLLAGSIALLWLIPNSSHILEAAVLIAAGVLVYGPQLLVPVAAADFASKKAAATATGLTGAFGYIGSALAGVGTGLIADRWGWNGGFIFFIIASILGGFCFMLTWKHRAPQLDKYHNSRKKKS
ncbi:MAG: MFS transporter [Proteobacteria bacterium]|nr:MFS transporter [Pseudomonadota bacterium]